MELQELVERIQRWKTRQSGDVYETAPPPVAEAAPIEEIEEYEATEVEPMDEPQDIDESEGIEPVDEVQDIEEAEPMEEVEDSDVDIENGEDGGETLEVESETSTDETSEVDIEQVEEVD